MSEHRYILEPYKGMNTRYSCPGCQQRDKTFSRYIDTETGNQLADNVGRCNRENNCGYHYTPMQYFQDNNISVDTPQPKAYKPSRSFGITPQSKPVSFISVEVFKASLKAHEVNHFVQFLINLFGVEVASQLVSRYFIATSKHWNGATVFWQIDTQGKVRTGKIILYHPTTGKRIKNLELPVYWVHKALKQPEYELRQCLFGEHLLIDKTKPVAIVESEKTAVIASVYLPQFIWVAVGSLTNLNAEKCRILKGRNVTLFPDLNGFEKWTAKAKELSHLATFTVSDLLERKATEAERKQGFDLADYLIKFNYNAFALPETEATEPPPAVQPMVDEKLKTDSYGLLRTKPAFQPIVEIKIKTNCSELLRTKPTIQTIVEVKPFEQPKPVHYFSKPEQPKPESWKQDITELENYFAGIALPSQPVKLNKFTTITNCSLFIESHFKTVKANNGKRTLLPYLNRLQELKEFLQFKKHYKT